MNWLVDTCVWSLALRRNGGLDAAEVRVLSKVLTSHDQVFTTGLILQELLQGFSGPKARQALLERFSALGFVQPGRADHIEAADIRNECRRHGVQLGTVDALLIQLSRRHGLLLLTSDNDFSFARRHVDFPLWRSDDSVGTPG